MDPISSLPAIGALLVAIITSLFLVKQFGAPPDQGRFASIDGLRGYLAFFVFLHHSCIWYFYLRTGEWKVPPSNLYTHFGQSSVALFFMITGFLFFSKLINGRGRHIDWGRLFLSRLLRLFPLYLFVMFLLLLVVAYLSNGKLNEPIPKLIKEMIRWLGFTILGNPSINGVEATSSIVARVTWSLPYEWFFYFSLPILALTVRVIPPIPYIVLGISSIIGLTIWQPLSHHLLSFLGGIVASFLVRYDSFRSFAGRRGTSFIIIGCVGIAVAGFPSAYGVAPLVLLSVAFALIASGNSLFGVLVSPVSRTLGEMAYSIYLLHGVTLFVTFNFIVGVTESSRLSSMMHWLLVIGVTPGLMLGCFLTFRFIERPAMHSTPMVMSWLRSRLAFFTKGRATDGVPLS